MPVEVEREQAPRLTPRELLTELETRFEVFRACQPLSIGIDKAIRARWPEVERKILRVALSMHTHGNRYLRALVKAAQRFDLDGRPAETLSEEHRQFAATILNERLQRQAEERRERASREREERRARETAGPEGQDKAARKGRKPASAKNVEGVEDATGQAPASPAPPLVPRRKHPAKSGAHPARGKTSGKEELPGREALPAEASASQDGQDGQAGQASLAEKLALLAAKYGRQ
jgi:ProP effector